MNGSFNIWPPEHGKSDPPRVSVSFHPDTFMKLRFLKNSVSLGFYVSKQIGVKWGLSWSNAVDDKKHPSLRYYILQKSQTDIHVIKDLIKHFTYDFVESQLRSTGRYSQVQQLSSESKSVWVESIKSILRDLRYDMFKSFADGDMTSEEIDKKRSAPQTNKRPQKKRARHCNVEDQLREVTNALETVTSRLDDIKNSINQTSHSNVKELEAQIKKLREKDRVCSHRLV